MIKMRRQEQCETRTTRMLSHLSSDEEYYTADEEINDIDQRLSLIYPNHIRFIIGDDRYFRKQDNWNAVVLTSL